MMTMTFSEACAHVYKKQLDIDLLREEKEREYLPQSAFGTNCRARGKALSFNADHRVDNFKALAIALHRSIVHGEEQEYEEEISVLSASMQEEDIQLATEGVTTYGWWKSP